MENYQRHPYQDAPTTQPADIPTEQQSVEESVVQSFRDFLGQLDFGPSNPENDPIERRAKVMARVLIGEITSPLSHLSAANRWRKNLAFYQRAEDETTARLLDFSGLPDQDIGEDFSQHPLTKRAREHAPKIVLAVAGAAGVAATVAAIHHSRHKRSRN